MEKSREDIIKELAKTMLKKDMSDLRIDGHNYIENTRTLSMSINDTNDEDLEKTIRVIKVYEEIFRKQSLSNADAMQLVYHLNIARKCIEKVLDSRK
jgi:hypothetical protein